MKYIQVKAGDVIIGNGRPVVVQTMCNTPTCDIDASFNQCVRLSKAGAQIIRLTTQGIKEVDALKEIKSRLTKAGFNTPLVADVHFSSEVALAAAEVADKVRINPGNFAKDPVVAREQFERLIDICKRRKIPIRIGVNHGSLGEKIIEKYGDTPLGMAEAALEWINMAMESDFNQIVISLKSSNTRVMTNAYRLLYESFKKSGTYFPLHLGVTEAGNGESGRIKSAVGLATLLGEGIGDTIRVSLTEDPANELPVASFIADYFRNRTTSFKYVSESKYSEDSRIISSSYNSKSWSDFILKASCDLGPLLLDNKIDDIKLNVSINDKPASPTEISRFRDELLQASRRKFTKPEYIACPGCGRTLFNLEEVFEEVKRRTSHLKGYNIAVMGCVVNGPGEMADADYGYVGEGRNKVSIYRGKTAIFRAVPQDEAIDKLLELIEEDRRSNLFKPRN